MRKRRLWKVGSTSKQELRALCSHFVDDRAPSRACIHGAIHHHARCEGRVTQMLGHYHLGFAKHVHEGWKKHCAGGTTGKRVMTACALDAASTHAFKSFHCAFAPRPRDRLDALTSVTAPVCHYPHSKRYGSPRSPQDRSVVGAHVLGARSPRPLPQHSPWTQCNRVEQLVQDEGGRSCPPQRDVRRHARRCRSEH